MNRKALIHGIIPALLLAISVGQIYAFTNFAADISSYIAVSQTKVQFAFSLGIFFLGMGAATFGKIVERNIKLSTVIGATLFLSGMLVTCLGVRHNSLACIYLGYGFLIGTGTGIIYISPVKTMMMWFPKYKALASAFPIICFGLGSTLSTILYTKFITCGVENIFLYFAGFYAILLVAGAIMLKKPVLEQHAAVAAGSEFRYVNLLKNRFFIHSWLFMFLNISSGLCLIPLAKQMMKLPEVGYSAALVSVVVGASGLLNGGGRFLFAWISDNLKVRINIIYWIIGLSLFAMVVSLCPVTIGVVLLVINACYGAGFSVIPAILSDKFGMTDISKIHGAVLSAWGVAGLVGNQLAIFVSDKLGFGYNGVVVMLIGLYALNMVNFLLMKRAAK